MDRETGFEFTLPVCAVSVIQSLAEGMNFGKKAGLDLGKVIDVPSKGAARSFQVDSSDPTTCHGEFEPSLAVEWMCKGLGIYIGEASDYNARLPVTVQIEQFCE